MKCRFSVRTFALSLFLPVAAGLGACNELVAPKEEPQFGINGIETWSCYDPSWYECSQNPPSGDPQPSAPGVYLGPNFSWSSCTSTSGPDGDGLEDFCEFQLALASRPLLATHPNDGALARQPHWAARRFGSQVVIFYALAYHWDGGSDSEWCKGDVEGGCLPHPGDAEWIELRLTYNTTTLHWELLNMRLSQHGNSAVYSNPEFPSKDRHYPRVWVARGKHANYKTRADCDSGAVFGADTCFGNVDDVRVEVYSARNLGSSSNQYVNRVLGFAPLYQGVEEFWNTNFHFCGWDADAAANGRVGCSRNTDYGDILLDREF